MMETAAPGQKSAKELMDMRVKEGLIEAKNFYLFGSPISKSLSPAMHNAGRYSYYPTISTHITPNS